MGYRKAFCRALAIGVLLGSSGQAIAAADTAKAPPKEPSFYVKCDGFPNNQSDGETAARLISAAAIIGLLAPKPEAADPDKRLLGAEGVAACNQVLEGEKSETNVERRLALLLGRAIHQIEAKNYTAAIADVAVARREAQAAGLMDNAYFRRSRALSFDQVEAAALVRLKRYAEADAMANASLDAVRYSLPYLLEMTDYSLMLRGGESKGIARAEKLARLYPQLLPTVGFRYIDAGRFADATRIFDDWIAYDLSFAKGKNWKQGSFPIAAAALAHALAGNWDVATKRAAEARANDQKRVADGAPESSRSATAEYLDLFEVLKLAKDGNEAGARRLFTGRSAWLEPPLGAVMAANAKLRPGAKPDDLIGALAKTADQMWEEKRDERLAELLAKDSDNKTLFALPTSYAKAGLFETLSGKVWKTDKSKILIKPKEPVNDDQIAFLYATPSASRYDAFLLHTALMARKDGKKQILFMPYKNDYGSVFVRMGNPGDPTMPPSLALNVDDLIAGLSPIIPDPVALKARRAAAPKK